MRTVVVLVVAVFSSMCLALPTTELAPPPPLDAPWEGRCACVQLIGAEYMLTVSESGLPPLCGSDSVGRGCVKDEQGWKVLTISTEPPKGMVGEHAVDEQMYAAGMIEGALTAEIILEHKTNVLDALLGHNATRVPEPVAKFLVAQHEWTRLEAVKHASDNSSTSASTKTEEDELMKRVWEYVGGLVAQVDGVVEGMRKVLPLSAFSDDVGDSPLVSVLFAAGAGDVPAMLTKYNVTAEVDFTKLSPVEVEVEVLKRVRCSALVRLTPTDLYSAHSTWWNYGTMLRVFKRTNFPVPQRGAPQQHDRIREAFSSYPGVLSSQDDFYVTSRDMVILQTTNTVYKTELFQLVKPESLLSWHRVRLANALADSGSEWAEIFRVNASGTYPNQYMVVDYELFTPGEDLVDGTLTVVEEIPGLIVSGDQTAKLRGGFWPSYNIPFYPEIYNVSGCADFAQQHGDDYSYLDAPRAKIFNRDAPLVATYEEFKEIMRSNNYKDDPLSKGDPLKTICGRGDLLPTPRPNGCIDTKTTNAALVRDLTADAINGPTRGKGGNSLPPFTWKEQHGALANQSHKGVAETFDFQFFRMAPLQQQ